MAQNKILKFLWGACSLTGHFDGKLNKLNVNHIKKCQQKEGKENIILKNIRK